MTAPKTVKRKHNLTAVFSPRSIAIAKNAPVSIKASLEMVRAAGVMCEQALWALNDAWGQRIIHTDDAREGPRAFLEKRSPAWAGR